METIYINVTEQIIESPSVAVTEIKGEKGDPGISPLYGDGDPPDPTDIEDGTLYFKYI
jgi:hypothetical protein